MESTLGYLLFSFLPNLLFMLFLIPMQKEKPVGCTSSSLGGSEKDVGGLWRAGGLSNLRGNV